MLAEAAEQTTGVSKADAIAFLESGEVNAIMCLPSCQHTRMLEGPFRERGKYCCRHEFADVIFPPCSLRQGVDEIAAAGQMLRQMGVNSIPTFIVDGRYKVSGAARSDEFVALFRHAPLADW